MLSEFPPKTPVLRKIRQIFGTPKKNQLLGGPPSHQVGRKESHSELSKPPTRWALKKTFEKTTTETSPWNKSKSTFIMAYKESSMWIWVVFCLPQYKNNVTKWIQSNPSPSKSAPKREKPVEPASVAWLQHEGTVRPLVPTHRGARKQKLALGWISPGTKRWAKQMFLTHLPKSMGEWDFFAKACYIPNIMGEW